MTLSQGLDRNKTQHLSHESVQGQAWVQHLSQEHDSHQCATWGHPWHLLSSPSPNPSVCPPWKEDQLSATTWRNKWDKWPARTTGLPGQMTITVTSCGGQCLGQKLLQSISFQDKCNMNLNWLMVHVSNESTHIHMDHKTQSQNEFHMIETWDFPILRPALLRTPKDHLAHVRLGTDRCIPWDYCNASWMTCQAFMMILCSALPPFMKPH